MLIARITLCLFLVVNLAHVHASDSQSGMVFGNKHVFYLKAPAGWILDNKRGRSFGLHAKAIEIITRCRIPPLN